MVTGGCVGMFRNLKGREILECCSSFVLILEIWFRTWLAGKVRFAGNGKEAPQFVISIAHLRENWSITLEFSVLPNG